MFGGNANNGTNAGGFYWNLNNGSGNVNQNIGARLYFFENVHNTINPCLLAKHMMPIKVLVGKPTVLGNKEGK